MDEGTASSKRKAGGTSKNGNSSGSAIRSSAQAYQNINRSLGSFYEEPAKEDAEKERLKAQLEELKARLEENEKRQSDKQEQLDLMEKSYQMAAKYLPGGTSANGMPAASMEQASSGSASEGTKRVNGKLIAMPVSGVRERVVSALPQQTTDEEVLEALSHPRNMGFLTAAGTEQTVEKNTLAAAVYSDQTVMDGQSVRLRLLEAMRVGTMTVPAGTLLSGTAKVQGERLGISVNLLEYQGTILPVELAVFDSDGQRGIFIPDLQSVNAAKEIVANMGTNVGTNISLSSDAGSQLAADMGRSLIQGTSQYVAKKLREVKVHLKAGYRLLLISEERLKND
jgi:conjugative transposon TraM protein